VSIITQTIDNAVVVPVEVICIDGEEVFVYVLEDGKAVKRDVELGISSDTHYQILSGITKDDILIKNTFGLEEGVSVES
jgi:multidrug efflux pump subunit AcrA (membrane-fusion protein)